MNHLVGKHSASSTGQGPQEAAEAHRGSPGHPLAANPAVPAGTGELTACAMRGFPAFLLPRALTGLQTSFVC